ncbi:translation elongation factor P [Allomyces macrogynus ATCC 38327]|uniref:Translation elongation factor P n=1 Tax=Allomyces macrogynus (strain ATCC 38327) TaxID=578462 RepID=A0A0L0S489_ALLM3|nr:translation elongation factor P [Allomyces macrogynus ATCC 38327]|eukprot:KNE57358.1 translation elongation factor P [Allomyces macrogynus ATCC 38327]
MFSQLRSSFGQVGKTFRPTVQQWAAIRGYKVTINNVRTGAVIEFRGKPHVVTKAVHSVMGRGSAHVKLDLKDVVTGARYTERFKTSDSVEAVKIFTRSLQYLYHDETEVHVMDPETFEQHAVPLETMQGGEKAVAFLQESTPISVAFLDNTAITAKLPPTFIFEVVDAPAIVMAAANATAKGVGYKVAVLPNGLRVEVPDFVVIGDKIECSVDENLNISYSKRVK